ncbi:hypothetical protein EST38_g4332 [Candolleomyces aberdarensis]|uniref:Uncharacterized protein n=1 Tax=Candolleomyces aberdarensis TaxID=2316362 RepID=A0A4Q2DRJ9_9AGAR|nr:hypothetical protein EST38_g4332 [Candolleomyces aberdarensis]
MVQASTLLVAAAFVVAPVLAAPAPALPHHGKHIAADSIPESSAVNRRSINNLDLIDIEARDPSFWGGITKVFNKVAPIVRKVAPIVRKVAPLILRRDEEGNVYVRELDADEVAYLQAREPISMGWFRKAASGARKGLSVANRVVNTAQSLGLRELDDEIFLEAREYDPSNFGLEERDFLDADDVLVEARFLDALD